MKRIVLPILFILIAVFPLFRTAAHAAEQPELNLAADALQSTGNPPVIPHAVRPDQDGEYCNACHRTGQKNAPPTGHPERLNCTSCHIQGEVKKTKPAPKGKKN